MRGLVAALAGFLLTPAAFADDAGALAFQRFAISAGYHKMAGSDVMLDGAAMAKEGARVLVTSFYVASGDAENLWVAGSTDNPVIIPLLTDQTARGPRATLLECRSQFIAAGLNGCRVSVIGTMTICRMTSGIEKPCLSIDGVYLAH